MAEDSAIRRNPAEVDPQTQKPVVAAVLEKQRTGYDTPMTVETQLVPVRCTLGAGQGVGCTWPHPGMHAGLWAVTGQGRRKVALGP